MEGVMIPAWGIHAGTPRTSQPPLSDQIPGSLATLKSTPTAQGQAELAPGANTMS